MNQNDSTPVDLTSDLPMTVDLGGLDRKLQRAAAVEQLWSLPQLPDEVKLDLASHPAVAQDHNGLGDFLWGLADDINQLVNPFAAQPAGASTLTGPGVAPVTPQAPEATPALDSIITPRESLHNDLLKAWNGIAGLKAPQSFADDAVVNLKQRAVRDGLLPADTPLDGSWSSDMNQIRAEVVNNDYESRMAGNKPGALSLDTAAKWLNEWTSPSGLMKAAMALDFIPDFHRIGEEASHWGDKWRSWAKQPWNPLKLIDAATGPLDDIVLPILNDAMLFTGVSETFAFARGAIKGAEAVRTAEEVGRGLKAIRGADVAADIEHLARPGWLAGHLQQTKNLAFVGDRMAQWRQATNVLIAKKAVQQGMKLGLLSTAEAKLFPGLSGWNPLTGTETHAARVEDFQNWKSTNPLVAPVIAVGEIALAPTNIFKPGAVSGVAHAAHSKVVQAISGLSRNDMLTTTVSRYMPDAIESLARIKGDDALLQRAAQFRQTLISKGPKAALLEYHGGEQEAGGWLMNVIAGAAADRAAAQKANALADATKPGSWRSVYHAWRDKYLAQLRHIDVPQTDEDWIEWAKTRAALGYADYGALGFEDEAATAVDRAASASTRKRLFEANYGAVFSPDEAVRTQARQAALEEIAHHQGMRNGAWNNLLDGLGEGDIAAYLQRNPDIAANWEGYNAALQDLRDFQDTGGLEGLARRLPFSGEAPWGGNTRGFREQLDVALLNPANTTKKAWLDKYGVIEDPYRGRLTVARADSATKQTADEVLSQIAFLRARDEGFKLLDQVPEAQQFVLDPLAERAAAAGQRLGDVGDSALEEWIGEIFKPTAGVTGMSRQRITALAKAARWADQNGLDLNEARAMVSGDLAKIENSQVWSQSFEIPGYLGLVEKEKALRSLRPFLAAEVDVPPELAARLAERGYKPVYGVDFYHPSDLAQLDGVLGEVGRDANRRLSLGNFLSPQSNRAVSILRERKLRDELVGSLSELQKAGKVPAGLDFSDPYGEDIQHILDTLRDAKNSMTANAAAVQDGLGNMDLISRVATRASTLRVPLSIHDLQPQAVEQAIGDLVSPEAAKAVTAALRRSLDIGWQYRGLMAIEDHLRANSPVMSALKVLGRTEAGNHGRLGAILSSRTMERLALGAGASTAVAANGGDSNEALAAGLGAAVVGPKALEMMARPAIHVLDDRQWFQYGKMAEHLANLRDYLRFSINPLFDARRYTKGWVLAQTKDLPDGVYMPLNTTLKGYAKAAARNGWDDADTVLAKFRAASRGDFDFDALDSTSKWFTQQGILGYNATHYMAAAYGHLAAQGVDPALAYELAKGMYSYGVHGRTPLEQSVNFLFFPFSFEKKLVKQAGTFLTNDLSRAVMLHDALKTYEILNQHYDLSEQWKEHLPILRSLQRLNAFAHGISPGELGGINRPIWDAFYAAGGGEVVDPILNLFIPQAVNIRTPEDAKSVTDIMRRLMPLQSEMNTMLDDLAQQKDVIFSKSHLSRQAQVDAGWAEWNAFKKEVDQTAKEAGYAGYQSLLHSKRDEVLPMQQYIRQVKFEIARKYPEWVGNLEESSKRAMARDWEMSESVNNGLAKVGAAPGQLTDVPLEQLPADPDVELAWYADQVSMISDYLAKQHTTFATNPEDVPPEVYDALRQAAVDLALRGNGFERAYNKYFRRDFGPIQREV